MRDYYFSFLCLYVLSVLSLLSPSVSVKAQPLFMKPIQPAFFVAIEGDFLKQSGDNTAYALLDFAQDDGDSPMGSTVYLEPDYSFSGGATLGYLFSNKVFVKYEMLLHSQRTTDMISALNTNGGHIDTILLPTSFFVSSVFSAHSRLYSRINTFGIFLGYIPQVSRVFHLLPYVGLGVIDLKTEQLTKYYEENGDLSATNDDKASVAAIGPEIGLTLSYDMFDPFSFVCDFSFGILIGNSRLSYDAISEDPNDSDLALKSKTHFSQFEVFKLKTGLQYRKMLSNMYITFLAGYRLMSKLNTTFTAGFPGGLITAYSYHNSKDAGYHGPFLSIGISFI